MKKEIGKWFMDIAKYLLTAVVVGALISDLESTRWLVYVVGLCSTFSCLAFGLVLLHQNEKQAKENVTHKTEEE